MPLQYLAVDLIYIFLGCRLNCAEEHDPTTRYEESRPCFIILLPLCNFLVTSDFGEGRDFTHSPALLQVLTERNCLGNPSKDSSQPSKYSERLKKYVFLQNGHLEQSSLGKVEGIAKRCSSIQVGMFDRRTRATYKEPCKNRYHLSCNYQKSSAFSLIISSYPLARNWQLADR